MFGSWTGATSHIASIPRMEVDAAQSKYDVFLLGFGGLAQSGSSSSQVFIVLLTVLELPAGEHRHLVMSPCAAFTAFSAALFTFAFALSAAFWGASRQFAWMWYCALPQMEQSRGTTNTVFPNVNVLAGQATPAMFTVRYVALDAAAPCAVKP